MSHVVEQEKPASPQLAHYSAEYRRAVAQTPAQPRWVHEARESAMAQFERLGFPTTKLEHWKYTDVSRLAKVVYRAAAPGVLGGSCAFDESIGAAPGAFN